IPATWLGLKSLGVTTQDLRRVFRWINAERNEMDVCPFERFLQFAHPAADHWTRSRAGAVNEICDPDSAAQISGAEIFSILIHQRELGNASVRRNRSLAKRVHLELPQPK